jgi:hypothetical protein
VDRAALVEVTSEENGYPIESGYLPMFSFADGEQRPRPIPRFGWGREIGGGLNFS